MSLLSYYPEFQGIPGIIVTKYRRVPVVPNTNESMTSGVKNIITDSTPDYSDSNFAPEETSKFV